MQDLGNSLDFLAGQRQILAAFFFQSSFLFDEIVELVKSFKRIIDLVCERRNSALIFRRRRTIFEPLISPRIDGRNNCALVRHGIGPLFSSIPDIKPRLPSGKQQLSIPQTATPIILKTMKNQRRIYLAACLNPASISLPASASSKLSTATTALPLC